MDGPELFHKKNSYIMHPSLGGNYPLSTMTKKGGIIISWNWVQTLSLFEEKKLILALCVEQGLLAAFDGHLYNWNKEVRGQLKGLGVGEDLTRSVARLILLDWDLWQRRASWQLTCTKDMWTTLQMPRRPFLREQGGARGDGGVVEWGLSFCSRKNLNSNICVMIGGRVPLARSLWLFVVVRMRRSQDLIVASELTIFTFPHAD